jgi:hypothetical protein
MGISLQQYRFAKPIDVPQSVSKVLISFLACGIISWTSRESGHLQHPGDWIVISPNDTKAAPRMNHGRMEAWNHGIISTASELEGEQPAYRTQRIEIICLVPSLDIRTTRCRMHPIPCELCHYDQLDLSFACLAFSFRGLRSYHVYVHVFPEQLKIFPYRM